jgi:hypothetical protein
MASFRTNVASFWTNVASFRTNVVSIRTNVACFRTNVASADICKLENAGLQFTHMQQVGNNVYIHRKRTRPKVSCEQVTWPIVPFFVYWNHVDHQGDQIWQIFTFRAPRPAFGLDLNLTLHKQYLMGCLLLKKDSPKGRLDILKFYIQYVVSTTFLAYIVYTMCHLYNLVSIIGRF